ncbi:MAG: DUF748 domain-containing protein [Planctomycetota bacterium]
MTEANGGGTGKTQKARKPGRWRRRLLVAIPGAVVLYALIGFFVVPFVAQRWVVPMVGEMLNGGVAVDTIRTNPFALSLTLEGVEVTDEQGTKVLGLGRLYGNLQSSSVFREGFVLGDVALDEPYVLAVLEEDGSLNLAKLLKPSDEPSAEPITLPRVRGDSLKINDATVDFVDHMIEGSPDRSITPISFTVDAFDTQPLHANRHHFSAATEAAENVTWEGEVYLNPLDATGTISVKDFDLSVYEPYVRQFAPLAIEGGLASLELLYEVAPARSDKAVNATLATLTVEGLDVDLAEHPLLSVASLAIDNAAADAVGRSVEVDRVAVSGVEVTGQREADGTFAVLKTIDAMTAGVAADEDVAPSTIAAEAALLPTDIADAVPRPYDQAVRALIETANDAVQPWTLRLEQLEVDATKANWRDLAMQPNVALTVTDTRLKTGPISSEDGFAVDFEAATMVTSGGAIAATGRVEPLAMRGSVTSFENTGFALVPFGPYVQQADPRLRLPAGQLDLTGADLSASLGDDGLPVVAIGSFTVGGGVDVEVHELGPPLSVPLRDLDVELIGLDTAAGDPADVSVNVRVYDGSIAVSGNVLPDLAEPLKSTIGLTILIDQFKLQPLTPVSGEYVGRAISDGTLNTKEDSPITVQLAQQQLEAVVPVQILGFDFGEKIDSENATTLPVDLAVAILKGPTGTISPPPIQISGDLSQPGVRLPPLIMHAVTNLVVGVASSPFQMLGGLVPSTDGDNAEPPDLSFVAFVPGSSAITSDARKKLDLLGKAMVERPALAMAIRGLPTRDMDEAPLRRVAFETALREKTAASLPENDSRRTDPSSIAVSEEQYRDAVLFAYRAMQEPAVEAGGATSESEPQSPALPAEEVGGEAVAELGNAIAETSAEVNTTADPEATAPDVAPTESEPEEAMITQAPEVSAAEELLTDEPAEMELHLPVLADDGEVASASTETRPHAQTRRLRAGRSMRGRTVRTPPQPVATEPERQPVSLPPTVEEVFIDSEGPDKATEGSTEAESTLAEVVASDREDTEPTREAAVAEDATATATSPEDAAVDQVVDADESGRAVTEASEATESEIAAANAPDDSATDGAENQTAGSTGTASVTEPQVSFEQAEREVLARVPLAADAFVDLRMSRVRAVADYLTGPAGLPASRIRVSEEPAEAGDDEPLDAPRVQFDVAAN